MGGGGGGGGGGGSNCFSPFDIQDHHPTGRRLTIIAHYFRDLNNLLAMQLIAKCETRQSLFNFKAIAQEADAIMLSRGNLGLDVLPEKMALVQKHVIQQCNMLGKPAIVTRVVDTMVSSPRPTRYSIFIHSIFLFSFVLFFIHSNFAFILDTMVSSPRPTRFPIFSHYVTV